MARVQFLIVGAGVTGLAFANWLRSRDYLILESEAEIGGYCRTVRRDGFIWDYAGHFFHFRHPEIERYLVDRMGGQRIVTVDRKSRIYYGGKLIWFPFQMNVHQLPFQEFLECLADLVQRQRDERAPSNFKEMLYGRYGRAVAEKFLVPYNEKLYATDLATLDVEAMGRFFPHADLKSIVANFLSPHDRGYNATFTYPEGGAIQYVRALAKGVVPSQIAIAERLVRIDLERRIAHTDRRDIPFDYLVSSVPFPSLLGMSGVPHDRSLYTHNKVEVFNLGFDRKGWQDVHWIYFPQRELIFFRVGFYDNILGTNAMSLYVEIGRGYEERVDAAGAARTLERVLADLRRVGIVGEHRLIAHHHVVMDPAYVHVTRAAQDDVADKKRLLALAGVYSVGRYGSWTYCSIEDDIVEARALAESFNALGGAPAPE